MSLIEDIFEKVNTREKEERKEKKVSFNSELRGLHIFDVTCLQAGQPRAYADSIYIYEIISNRSKEEVREFCMTFVRRSYEQKNMPNPFAPRLVEFAKIEGRKLPTYYYKVIETYTG